MQKELIFHRAWHDLRLDVLRALRPAAGGNEVLEAYVSEIGEAAGGDARLDAFIASLRRELADIEAIEDRARWIARHAPATM